MNRLLVVLAAGVLAIALSTALIERSPERAEAAFTYHKCGSFRYKGKHLLFTHKYRCAKAERTAKYVLRTGHAPSRWKCSLAELSSGFAACESGKRAWEFVPARGS